jgi:hypothetical protein
MDLLSTEPEAFAEPEPAIAPTHDIVHELTIAAAPEAVYDALTTSEGMARWWGGDCDASLVEGQVATLPLDDENAAVRVDLTERPEAVQWECVQGPREWVGTTVAFRIEGRPPRLAPEAAPSVPDGPVSVVRFWHGGWAYEDGLLPRASFDWAMRLARLRHTLEAGADGAA